MSEHETHGGDADRTDESRPHDEDETADRTATLAAENRSLRRRVEELEASLAEIHESLDSEAATRDEEPDDGVSGDGSAAGAVARPSGGQVSKVVGKLDESAGGVGVFGYNVASSGSTYGVWGEVDSSAGYGLYTPDDARVDGVVETDTLSSGQGSSLTLASDDGAPGFVVEVPGTDSNGHTAGANVVGGHRYNQTSFGGQSDPVGVTIGGGGSEANENEVADNYGTIAGGYGNEVGNYGGDNDPTTARFGTVGGGRLNHARGEDATVAGGRGNDANGVGSSVGGGESNSAALQYATVAGGENNTAYGRRATVPGGRSNTANGNYSFAAGRVAEANHQGTFVWSDSADAAFTSTGEDQFLVDAAGGVGIATDSPSAELDVGGVIRKSKVGLDAYLSNTQTVSPLTDTTVAFDAVRDGRDDFGGYDTSTGAYDVAVAGDYHVDFTVNWVDSFAEGDAIQYRLLVNGDNVQGFESDTTIPGNVDPARGYSKTLFGLDVGDTITVEVWHNASTDKDVLANNQGNTYLTIHQVG